MTISVPRARLGFIVSSNNQTVEHYARSFIPDDIAVHVTRMHMGGGRSEVPRDVLGEAVAAATLLREAGLDVIGLQATGILMARGPEYERQVVAALKEATGLDAFTATQAAAEALTHCGIKRVILVNPLKSNAVDMEARYLEALGFSVVEKLALGGATQSASVAPEDWSALAETRTAKDFGGIFLSGSNTRMLEAIPLIEAACGKPVIASVQASFWTGLRRLSDGLADVQARESLGQLFAI